MKGAWILFPMRTIEIELMLADIESIEKRLQGLSRKVRGRKGGGSQERLLKAALEVLEKESQRGLCGSGRCQS